MTNKDLEKMTKHELEKILREEDKWTEEDIIKASIELGKRDKEEGNFYTTAEVLEQLFGKHHMVK